MSWSLGDLCLEFSSTGVVLSDPAFSTDKQWKENYSIFPPPFFLRKAEMSIFLPSINLQLVCCWIAYTSFCVELHIWIIN